MSGMLYIVPTPIGNLEDITLRAIRILRETPTIACEDTRVTANLLRHFEIPHKRLISYFAGNEAGRVGQIIGILEGGEDVALVSDAGTPGISDPGTRLIAAAIERGITVVPLPGPSAMLTALTASGLPTDAIVFEGFLPHKKGRQTMLRRLADEERTIVLYESPHRIVKTLRELAEHLGDDRPAVLGRELTKLYEEINRASLGELHADYAGRASIKGEFVVVVAGRERKREGEGGMGREGERESGGE
jgi:16S rRNA (cytidine1402-2'-O)-methyltransferase